MPGLNGKGPMGQGTRTGRGLGNCNPASDTKNSVNITRSFGKVFGRGSGRGMRRAGFRSFVRKSK